MPTVEWSPPPRSRRAGRIPIWAGRLAAGALLTLATSLSSVAVAAECPGGPVYPKEPFVDANCDECFDLVDGDRLGVHSSLLGAFVGQPGECLVIPRGARLQAPKEVYLQWHVDGAVWLRGDVRVPGSEFGGGGLIVESSGDLHVDGTIAVGREGILELETTPTSEGASIYLGSGARLTSFHSPFLNARGVVADGDPSMSWAMAC